MFSTVKIHVHVCTFQNKKLNKPTYMYMYLEKKSNSIVYPGYYEFF